jgi:hypothetical protein
MTKQWFLLKGIDRDASVMFACADVLRALGESPPPDWPKERLESALRESIAVLGALNTSVRIQLGELLEVDPYYYRLSLRVGQETGLPPAALQDQLTAAIADLREQRLSPKTADLLKVIVRTSQKLATSRWTELRSSPTMAFH